MLPWYHPYCLISISIWKSLQERPTSLPYTCTLLRSWEKTTFWLYLCVVATHLILLVFVSTIETLSICQLWLSSVSCSRRGSEAVLPSRFFTSRLSGLCWIPSSYYVRSKQSSSIFFISRGLRLYTCYIKDNSRWWSCQLEISYDQAPTYRKNDYSCSKQTGIAVLYFLLITDMCYSLLPYPWLFLTVARIK